MNLLTVMFLRSINAGYLELILGNLAVSCWKPSSILLPNLRGFQRVGRLLARLGHKSHSSRDAALLYSSLKADLHLQTSLDIVVFVRRVDTRTRTMCVRV